MSRERCNAVIGLKNRYAVRDAPVRRYALLRMSSPSRRDDRPLRKSGVWHACAR